MAPSYRRPVGRANVGGFRLQVTVEDRGVRRALRSMRKYASRDAKEATKAAVDRELPAIRRGVPAVEPRGGHVRDRIVARARSGGYPYLTALGKARGHLGVLEFGGVRRDVVRSKRSPGRVLWSGARRHPRTQYVTKSLHRNTPRLHAEIEEILADVLQRYIDAAGTFKGRAG